MEPREYQMCVRVIAREEMRIDGNKVSRLFSLSLPGEKRTRITHVRRLAFTKPNDIPLRKRRVCFEEYAKYR